MSSRGGILVRIEVLLLCADPGLAEELSARVRERFRDAGTRFAIELLHEGVGAPDVEARVAAAREARGAGPIGAAPSTEEACLQALRGGADEALVVGRGDPAAQRALIDRALQRAQLRRHSERLSASIGHAEKLAALGTLVAGVAHEINNPLGAASLSFHALEIAIEPLARSRDELRRLAELGRAVQPEELQRLVQAIRAASPSWDVLGALEDIQVSIAAITDVVRDLRVFARTDDEEEPGVVDVVDVIDQVLRIVRREIEQAAVLERDLPREVPPLLVPRTRLAQVLTNVLINAAHAVREVERPVHRVRISVRADDDAVAIVVSDTGPGIAPQDIDRIFDPFFTTKRQDLGTGLGLSISRSILRRLGGDLLVDSVYGEGAEFLVMVPRPDPSALREAGFIGVPTGANETRKRRLTVLAVDADERMVRAYSRALSSRHDVVLASDGEEAIELLASGTEADVILTELGMPGVDGRALLDWLKRERPRLAPRVLFTTSTLGKTAAHAELEREGLEVLPKPLVRDALLEAIERASER